jgi:diguanylate cyclase (GGDEF)-like protein
MTDRACSLLIVHDEPILLDDLVRLLRGQFEILTAASGEAARKLFARRQIDLVLTSQDLPGMKGIQLLEWIGDNHPTTVRLLMTGLTDNETMMEAVNRGHIFAYIIKPWYPNELGEILGKAARVLEREQRIQRLKKAIRHLKRESEKDCRQLKLELEEIRSEWIRRNLALEKQANTDPLTCLLNRRAFQQLTEDELRRRERYCGALSVGLIDADHFKRINTRYTHPGGDQVLMGLAKTLPRALRTVDRLGRFAGEEFQVLAPETSLAGAKSLGKRICSTVAKAAFNYEGQRIKVTVSVGLAVAEADVPADFEKITRVAARALREAKGAGRNRCVVRRIPDSGV